MKFTSVHVEGCSLLHILTKIPLDLPKKNLKEERKVYLWISRWDLFVNENEEKSKFILKSKLQGVEYSYCGVLYFASSY